MSIFEQIFQSISYVMMNICKYVYNLEQLSLNETDIIIANNFEEKIANKLHRTNTIKYLEKIIKSLNENKKDFVLLMDIDDTYYVSRFEYSPNEYDNTKKMHKVYLENIAKILKQNQLLQNKLLYFVTNRCKCDSKEHDDRCYCQYHDNCVNKIVNFKTLGINYEIIFCRDNTYEKGDFKFNKIRELIEKEKLQNKTIIFIDDIPRHIINFGDLMKNMNIQNYIGIIFDEYNTKDTDSQYFNFDIENDKIYEDIKPINILENELQNKPKYLWDCYDGYYKNHKPKFN